MEDIKDTSKDTITNPKQTEIDRPRYCFRSLLKKHQESIKCSSTDNIAPIELGERTLKYLPFILARVKKSHIRHHRRYTFEELLDEAILASLVAEKRYKPELGWDFSTYAKFDIEGALTRFTSSLSNTQLVLFSKLTKFINKYSAETGKHPSKESIIKGLNISEEKYKHLLQDLEPPIIVPYTKVSDNSEMTEEVELGLEEAVQESDIMIQDILRIIKDLESPTKEIIEMSVIQEMSIDSLAIFLGVSKQVAQGRIDSAKAELRDILELHGITG